MPGVRASAPPRLAEVVRDQRVFLGAAALVGVLRLAVPAWRGAAPTWTALLTLWLLGALVAAWRSRALERTWLVARVGVQNAALQLLVTVPAIVVGTSRFLGESSERPAAFFSNALATLLLLPLLSAVVLTCAGLVVAVPMNLLFRRLAASALLVVLVAAAGSVPVGATPPVCGQGAWIELDHVPVAVADLEAAGRLFRALGFALKPGRPHDNGLRNLHAKFRDGREIELITVDTPGDDLGRWYAERLAEGPGPVFLALHAGPLADVAVALEDEREAMRVDARIVSFPVPDHRWRHLFFGRLNFSLTDEPGHFAHANGARTLHAVWVAGADPTERELVGRFGADDCVGDLELPGVGPTSRVGLRNSSLYLLAGDEPLYPGRSLVGLTVVVDDLGPITDRAAALRLATHVGRVAGAPSVVLDLRRQLGAWVEFRGPARGPGVGRLP